MKVIWIEARLTRVIIIRLLGVLTFCLASASISSPQASSTACISTLAVHKAHDYDLTQAGRDGELPFTVASM